ncbi:hypothetical protein K431DRAFT_242347, partial [Polychaeton citri CBS 116435]
MLTFLPRNYGFNNGPICSSPRSSFSESSSNRHSMDHHDAGHLPPAGSLQAEYPAATSDMDRLSLEAQLTGCARPLTSTTTTATTATTATTTATATAATTAATATTTTTKRPADADLCTTPLHNKRSTCGPQGIKVPRPQHSTVVAGHGSPPQRKLAARGVASRLARQPQARDSGYESMRLDSTDTSKSWATTPGLSPRNV